MEGFTLGSVDLTRFLYIAIATASAASVFVTLSSIIRLRRSIRSTKLKLGEVQLDSALLEGGITRIGQVLRVTIGDVSVAEYVADESVASRVDKYISSIVGYLGSEESVRDEAAQALGLLRDRGEPDLEEMRSAAAEYFHTRPIEEPWMQLAALRRDVELTLRRVASQAGLSVPQLASAGKLMQMLRKHGLIHPMAFEDLRIAIAVANQAIHGKDLSDDEMSEAIFLARRALASLENQRNDPDTYPYDQ